MSKKAELLGKYADKAVTPFWQYDAFQDKEDDLINLQHDEEGDCCHSMQTWELMAGSDVRVLVGRTTSQAVAIRLMGKIIKHMEEHFPKEKFVMNEGLVWEDNERQNSEMPF